MMEFVLPTYNSPQISRSSATGVNCQGNKRKGGHVEASLREKCYVRQISDGFNGIRLESPPGSPCAGIPLYYPTSPSHPDSPHNDEWANTRPVKIPPSALSKRSFFDFPLQPLPDSLNSSHLPQAGLFRRSGLTSCSNSPTNESFMLRVGDTALRTQMLRSVVETSKVNVQDSEEDDDSMDMDEPHLQVRCQSQTSHFSRNLETNEMDDVCFSGSLRDHVVTEKGFRPPAAAHSALHRRVSALRCNEAEFGRGVDSSEAKRMKSVLRGNGEVGGDVGSGRSGLGGCNTMEWGGVSPSTMSTPTPTAGAAELFRKRRKT